MLTLHPCPPCYNALHARCSQLGTAGCVCCCVQLEQHQGGASKQFARMTNPGFVRVPCVGSRGPRPCSTATTLGAKHAGSKHCCPHACTHSSMPPSCNWLPPCSLNSSPYHALPRHIPPISHASTFHTHALLSCRPTPGHGRHTGRYSRSCSHLSLCPLPP